MTLKKITGKDFKEAVDWLLKEKQGCVHKVLGRTDEGTELCLVIGWADIGYDLEKVKKGGYEDEGYYICSKIGYQHRNNGMQSDFEWDFPMPYNPETGDVWDTDTYVAKGDEQSWQTDADMYNKVAEEIWATWGVPNEDGQTTLDIMESKKCSRKCGSKKSEAKKHTCSMQKKKESLGKKSEANKSEGVYGTIRVDSEDIAIKVQSSHEYPSASGRSFTVEAPKVEVWFSTLSEFSDCIDGLAENCNGYPDISRDGSDILVQINAPKGDGSDDYEVIVELRCSTEITSTSLEGVVDLLNHD